MKKPFDNFEISGRNLVLQQGLVRGEATLGLTVWDGALVLSKYFEHRVASGDLVVANKSCLELGAGTGLVGIALGILGNFLPSNFRVQC